MAANRQDFETRRPSGSGPGGGRDWLRTETVLVAFGVGVLIWLLSDVLLAIFAGILIAAALDALAVLLAEQTHMRRSFALLIVVVLLALLIVAGPVAMMPSILDQIGGVWERLSALAEKAIERASEFPVLESVLTEEGIVEAAPATSLIAEQIATFFLDLMSGAALLVIVVATGLFLAYDPGLYTRGFLRLVPSPARELWGETLASIGYALRWWLLGQLVSMTVLFVVTSTGLYLFGIDLWLGLGVLTGLFTFVPFLGPAIAAVPILLISFSDSVATGLGVTAFYLIVQNLEGTFLTPIVQQRAVRLPPALLITSQVAMSALFGVSGLILAAPLTAVGMIGVNLLYIEGVLHERRATPKSRIRPSDDKTPETSRTDPKA